MAARKSDHRQEVTGRSPLARFIAEQMETNKWSLADLVRNADRRDIEVSDETLRFALNDKHKTPLRQETVDKIAAALGVPATRIRDLDSQRWSPAARKNEVVASGISPELAATLADLDPAEVQRVIDFARGIKSGR